MSIFLKAGRIVTRNSPIPQLFLESRRTYAQVWNRKLGVVGVPFGKGQKKEGDYLTGLQKAPAAIRGTGFKEELQNLGVDVKDYGDVSYKPKDLHMENMINLDHVAPLNEQLSNTVQKVLKDGRTCLNLGGDHTIAVGSIHGHLSVAGEDNMAVVYIDAHTDINTNTTSPSGNIHGMTLGLLANEMKGEWQTIPGMEWINTRLGLRNLAFIGIRSVDAGEAAFIRKYGIAAYSMEEVDRFGALNVLNMALKRIDPAGNKAIHVSMDIDSVDPREAPSTTLPVRGGLTLREGQSLLETLHRTGRLAVMDLVEVNPCLGTKNQQEITLEAVKYLLLSAFGQLRQGNELTI